MILRQILYVLSLSVLMPFPDAPADEVPRVVASILPVHSLVSGVMRGVGTPSLIVRGYGSPHTYRIRPSDAVKLHNADLVFWIGDALESFLRKPLSSLPKPVRAVSLMETDGLTLLKNREGGLWEHHHRTSRTEPARLPGTGHGNFVSPLQEHPGETDRHTTLAATETYRRLGYNPHIWLDPKNAEQLVRTIAHHLSELDPVHEARYKINASDLLQRMEDLAERLRKQLSGLTSAPYLVFHDAYPYLETRYGLQAVGTVTAAPDTMPSARRIAELRSAIERLNIRCIFREPQFDAKVIEVALGDANITWPVTIRVLDPLGVGITPGPGLWFDVMENHARAMADCLGPTAGRMENAPSTSTTPVRREYLAQQPAAN
ncbi:MAG: zinc transport system substrate-binding protein [Candidatus Kentron sp. G]|nr:MAG: zinc transport system substrate-binding protein [Candidatus Kentron sp. G]VFM97119.1 MAG: zinc transport system substrate-binding protein [Candidatus Kentron sp. G]VFN00778.1 MAG: zinc transport system substrate-binding protein [Candidatus Kentron sp. G]